MRQLQAYRISDRHPINPGDTVTDFRGNEGTYQGAGRAWGTDGRSGKITVDGREYYDRVWGLVVEYVAE